MLLYIGIIANVLLVAGGITWSVLGYNNYFTNWVIESMSSKATQKGMKEKIRGERCYIEREGKRPVRVNLYRAKEDGRPVVFLCHGGSFHDCDADDIDDFCMAFAARVNLNIVSISYTKIDVHVTSYPQDEIADVIRTFYQNPDQYRMDTKHYMVMGIEAGAYLSLIAGISLVQSGIFAQGYLFINPFVDYVATSFALAHLHPEPVYIGVTHNNNEAKINEYDEALSLANVYVRIKYFIHEGAPLFCYGKNYSSNAGEYEDSLSWIEEILSEHLS